MRLCVLLLFFFFFNDTATTEIYTLSLHDALPISSGISASIASIATMARMAAICHAPKPHHLMAAPAVEKQPAARDRKSTRLNSSHLVISYAVFCLKKKKTNRTTVRVFGTSRHLCN